MEFQNRFGAFLLLADVLWIPKNKIHSNKTVYKAYLGVSRLGFEIEIESSHLIKNTAVGSRLIA